MPQYEYKIVAGWNGTTANVEGLTVASAVGLDTIYSLLDTDTHYFVHGLGEYDVPYQFTPSGATQNGFAIERWTFPVISTIALDNLIENYAQHSSQAGKVTVNTRLHTETYVEKNAYLFVAYPNTHATKLRSNLYAYINGVVKAELRIVGDTA